MKSIRRFVLVGAFIIGAIFTPPDVMSQILLAIPLYLLYELGIILATLLMKQSAQKTAAATRQNQQDSHKKNE
jgi:sec-independent protein translocase protein TatC